MNLKKLNPDLVAGLQEAGFAKEPKKIQTASVSQIKSGSDLFIISPKGTGKSTALVIGVIQKLKVALEVAPRAIIMVSTKEKAFELEELFEKIGKRTDLRYFTVFDRGVIQYQKDMIYEGLDVLIGTPKRLNELIKINGIPLSEIQIFAVDDTDSYTLNKHPLIFGVANNVDKSQLIVLANEWNNTLEKIEDRVMKNPKVIKTE